MRVSAATTVRALRDNLIKELDYLILYETLRVKATTPVKECLMIISYCQALKDYRERFAALKAFDNGSYREYDPDKVNKE